MRKKRFCRIAGVIAAFVVIALLVSSLTSLTVWKTIYKEKDTFLDKAGDCDVLFFGNSRIRDSVFPMELWGEHGIAGYNLGFPGTSVQSSYWALMNALDYAQPELVVVESCHLSWTTEQAKPHVQSGMPVFPLSITKIRTALDIFPPGDYSFEDTFSVLMPLSLFHSRWSELEAEDFGGDKNNTLGACECVGAVRPVFDSGAPADADYTKVEKNVNYMRRIAQACEERGIKLIFCYSPHPVTNTEKWEVSVAEETAEELGVRFVNFLETDTVDYGTDMFDTDSHLNISGGRKISRYWGNLLSEEYGIADHRGESGYSSWAEDYKRYLKEWEQRLSDDVFLNNSLLTLSYGRYSSLIHIPAGSELFEDELAMELIENLAGEELPGLRKAAETGEEYLLFTDRSAASSYEASGEDIYDAGRNIKLSSDRMKLSVGAQTYPLSLSGIPGEGDVRVFVFTPELELIPECCHSFGLNADGVFDRTDY